jgi:hypothetical protein
MSPHIDGSKSLSRSYGSHQQRICGTMTVPLGRYSSTSQERQMRWELGPGRTRRGRMMTRGRRLVWAASV